MEKKEEYGDINPDKVIEDSRTIRRPQAAVERVQGKPNGEPDVDDAPVMEPEHPIVRESVPMPEQQSEPSPEPVSVPTISVAAIPKQQSESTAPVIAPAPAPKRQEQRESFERRLGLPSYREVFVSRNEIKHRQCVYISHEVHSLVSSLVRVLVEEGGEITVGGYIDRVLYEHLQAYKDEINEMYRNRRPELLK